MTATISTIWKNEPMKITSELLHFADAGPQDQQWNEGRRRQIARERDERLEERLDRLVRAHRDAEGDADQRGEHEAAEHPPDRDADVLREPELRESAATPRRSIVSGSARNVFDTRPPNVAMLHASDEKDEERQPQRDLGVGVTGLSGVIPSSVLLNFDVTARNGSSVKSLGLAPGYSP